MKTYGFFMRRIGHYVFLCAENKPAAVAKAGATVRDWCTTFGQVYDDILDTPKVHFWNRIELRKVRIEATRLIQQINRGIPLCQGVDKEISQGNLKRARWSFALLDTPIE